MLQGSMRAALAALLTALLAQPVVGQINMTGSWNVQIMGIGDIPWDFLQTGTALTSTEQGFEWVGTIDPVTGVFQIHPTDQSIAMAMQCGLLDGTVTPAGNHFDGVFRSAPLHCTGPPHFPMCQCGAFGAGSPAIGTRLSSGLCGDGAVQNDEQCDDGNTQNGDCCSSLCTYEGPGLPCFDNEPCTADFCDGAGQCVHTPEDSCRTASQGAKISLRNDGSAGGRLRWRWKDASGGTSLDDFGNPASNAAYRLCVFAGDTLVYAGDAPASSRWRAVANGFVYKSPDGDPAGLIAAKLRSVGSNTKLLVKGKGPLLTIDGSLAVPSLRVQLKRDGYTPCWEAVFDQPKVSEPDRFVAKE